jgi:hypothetical protein
MVGRPGRSGDLGGGEAESSAAEDAEAAPSLMRMQRRVIQGEKRRDAWGTAALVPCCTAVATAGVSGGASPAAGTLAWGRHAG